MLRWLLTLVAVPALAASGPPDTPPQRTDFSRLAISGVADCDAWVKAAPQNLLSYACFQRAALRPEWRGEALRHLEALAAVQPPDPRAQLYLGMSRLRQGPKFDAETPLRAAAQGLEEQGERVGEVYARLYLEFALRRKGRAGEGRVELLRAQAIAESLGDPFLVAFAQCFEGWGLFVAGDYGTALVTLERARDVLVRGPNGYLESLAWEGIAGTSIQLGRYRAAMEAEERRIRALERDGAPTALARTSLANRAFYLADTGELPWSEVDRLIDQAMDEARRAGSAEAEYGALSLHAFRRGATAEGVAELEECLAFARRSGQPYELTSKLWHLARARAWVDPSHPEEGEALIGEAIAIARANGFLDQLGDALLARALIRWRQGDGPAAGEDAKAALDVLELDRDRQYEESARIGVLKESWAFADVAQALIRQGDLPAAFAASERMRARSLLDSLRGDHAIEPLPPALADRGRVLRARLTELQSKLLDPALDEPARHGLKDALGVAEAEERALRADAAHVGNRSRRDAEVRPLELAPVQAALAPDEALVAYLVAPTGHADRGDFVHGRRSWVAVVTREGASTAVIPDRDELTERVSLFRSLVERRDGSEIPGAVRLHADLLADVLGTLSPGIRRLVLVLDGPLHALPFEALRASAGAPVLAERFAIVRSPSATLWARWRQALPVELRSPLLALADPGIPAGQSSAVRQAAPWLDGLQLGALPHARREAERAVRVMGDGSVALVGPEASEHALKTWPLRHWAVLHLAAHAVMDDELPQRSAVVLAPGAPGEDGLLQMRDVAGLDLEGMLVVLASCRSASGLIQGGEGPVGLARAFLQAGARAVLVSLWEIGDAASERLFAEFYKRLADGVSVEDALRDAQRARIRAGAPSADWAGLVLIGDGNLRVPRASSPRGWAILLAGATLTAAVALAGLGLWVRRRRR